MEPGQKKAKEGIVLDREGNTVYIPEAESRSHGGNDPFGHHGTRRVKVIPFKSLLAPALILVVIGIPLFFFVGFAVAGLFLVFGIVGWILSVIRRLTR